MNNLIKKSRNFLKRAASLILIPAIKKYLKKPRLYVYDDIQIIVSPGVFHPGLFFSTKILLRHLKNFDLAGKKVLELGAGSGLIAIYCRKSGAEVTASDISGLAIENMQLNCKLNNVDIDIIHSDLFDGITGKEYNLIVINPPYFAKNPENESEMAWYCGSNYEYFRKLFSRIKFFLLPGTITLMILSEDCAIDKIKEIAELNRMSLRLVSASDNWFETNYIYSIENCPEE